MLKGFWTRWGSDRPWQSRLLSWSLAAIAAVFCWATPVLATGVYDLPALNPGENLWVIDQAGAISLDNENKLSGTLEKLAANQGQEVRVAVIRRLNYDETIDSFADELFDRWFPTPEAKTHQTLVVLDTLTNNSALRRGAGVTELVPDDIADSLLKDNLGIPIRQGNKYNEALLSAGDRLVALLSGQDDPGAPQFQDNFDVESNFVKAGEGDNQTSLVWVIGLLLAATVIPMVTYFAYVGLPGR
ncbi:MAG: TPM domain-containing protein [Jaaginema sp. PMC 1079.18]|nr:TPM domain-containing protein [Jaaginema sp. PMC 1080.18]MEC4852148.1 TPM domain-containing protein [Jaaginema sp. PMC 1079.18]MEC4866275.1 TPM domain-containing protein [Jaaginema sp. PMC 1078.18]